MRILILHSRYLSGDASGENRVAEDEARLLRDAGHEVRLWAPEPQVGGTGGRVRTAGSAIWSRSAAERVAAAVRDARVEVVHVHNLFPTLSPLVLRRARRAGAAVVMTLHNYRLACLPANLLRDGALCEACVGRLPWRGVIHACYRDSRAGSAVLATSLGLHRALGTFDAVVRFLAVSEFVRGKHVEAGIPEGRISVKPNFSAPLPERDGSGEFFLFLGRLSHEKGVDVLLEAWRRDDPPGRLVIVGDGPEAAALRRSAPAGVEFRPPVPAGAVGELLRRARALLLPSRWYEAAPRTIVEAYSAGVPVLASDLGALRDAVDVDETGFLVPNDDPAAWAAAAGRLGDDAESMRLGRGARAAWTLRYSPERGLRDLEAAYRDAIDEVARGSASAVSRPA